jgi:hypothetical protein
LGVLDPIISSTLANASLFCGFPFGTGVDVPVPVFFSATEEGVPVFLTVDDDLMASLSLTVEEEDLPKGGRAGLGVDVEEEEREGEEVADVEEGLSRACLEDVDLRASRREELARGFLAAVVEEEGGWRSDGSLSDSGAEPEEEEEAEGEGEDSTRRLEDFEVVGFDLDRDVDGVEAEVEGLSLRTSAGRLDRFFGGREASSATGLDLLILSAVSAVSGSSSSSRARLFPLGPLPSRPFFDLCISSEAPRSVAPPFPFGPTLSLSFVGWARSSCRCPSSWSTSIIASKLVVTSFWVESGWGREEATCPGEVGAVAIAVGGRGWPEVDEPGKAVSPRCSRGGDGGTSGLRNGGARAGDGSAAEERPEESKLGSGGLEEEVEFLLEERFEWEAARGGSRLEEERSGLGLRGREEEGREDVSSSGEDMTTLPFAFARLGLSPAREELALMVLRSFCEAEEDVGFAFLDLE